MVRLRFILRFIGSLWFAAALLVVALVAMGCATVFESAHGTDRALFFFYHAWWFELLLALVAVNVAAAMADRYPFTRRQTGFVLTHGGILLTLGGALVTKHLGVNGQVGIIEGQTVGSFSVPMPALRMANRTNQTQSTVDLPASTFAGFEARNAASADALTLDGIRVVPKRYLPDSTFTEEVVNDAPHPSQAVHVRLSVAGDDFTAWLFANHVATLGPAAALFRPIATEEEYRRIVAPAPGTNGESDGLVRIELAGSDFEIPLNECQEKAVPVGDTGYTVRVLQYVPHAVVGPDNSLTNAPRRPLNPAIEVELIGPGGRETRKAFSRFPDIPSMHGTATGDDLKLTFIAPTSHAAAAPIEILGGGDGRFFVRFRLGTSGGVGSDPPGQEVALASPVETPWSGSTLTVLDHFDRARLVRNVMPIAEMRRVPSPAVQVAISAGGRTQETWLQKYEGYQFTFGGVAYDLGFSNKQLPLGFDIRLDDFRIGYYPGTRRDRSYESHITILDPVAGGTQSRVVSMNHPVEYGRYTLYQSSFLEEPERAITYLRVSRDPGQAIAFAGYISMFVGMCVVLGQRVASRRRVERKRAISSRQTIVDHPALSPAVMERL